jgi:hypothetical protein
VSPTLLGAWFELAAGLSSAPDPPQLAPTWIELVPTGYVDLRDPAELVRLDQWTNLAAVLAEHAPEALGVFGFPGHEWDVLRDLFENAERCAPEHEELLARSLSRLGELTGLPRPRRFAARVLARERAFAEPSSGPAPPPPERAIVARILRDLS